MCSHDGTSEHGGTGLVESFIVSSVTIRSYASISMCYEGCLLPRRRVFYRVDKKKKFEQSNVIYILLIVKSMIMIRVKKKREREIHDFSASISIIHTCINIGIQIEHFQKMYDEIICLIFACILRYAFL